MIIAISLEDSVMVLNNLFIILLVAYPLILLVLFLIARFIAGRSIKPISAIIETSNIITKDNLKSRIPLPINKDELHLLADTINNLLDRVENAIEREKQFTSDASHELRTPLAVIKGTLEVLVRKPRNQEEYREKIDFCINEVNRLNHLVDELLLLARFENQKQSLKTERVSLNAVFLDIVSRNSTIIREKKLNCMPLFTKDCYIETDSYLFSLIVNNVLTNAIKYSKEEGVAIRIYTKNIGKYIRIVIEDNGIGMNKETLKRIFEKFYRAHTGNIHNVKGFGIGLSYVKAVTDAHSGKVSADSLAGKGSVFTLQFPLQNQ
jgi:signal transduction histidine kinase